MNPIEQEIVIAFLDKKISALDLPFFKQKMIELIGKTHLNCGFKLDENQLDETIDELCDDLKKYNHLLSFKEIELAFKNGYKKKYGDFFGLNNATYFGWVNAYTWSEVRLKCKKTILNAQKNTNHESEKKTKGEIDEILRNACLKSFEDFKAGISIFDFGNVKYNFLVEIGALNFNKERKREIKEKIEAKLRQEAIENKRRDQSIAKILDSILPETIISESKKEALRQFFSDLIEIEEELINLI